MAYGHAERNLTLIRQLEAETRKLLGSMNQLDPEQSAWLQGVAGPRVMGSPSSASPLAKTSADPSPGRLWPLGQQLVS